MMAPNSRRKILVLLQWLVALAAFAFIAYRIQWAEAWQVLRQADLRWAGAALALALAAPLPAAGRWSLLLRAVGVAYPPGWAYRLYLIGTFFGLAMPGAVGGDGARIWLGARDTRAGAALLSATVLAERALGVVALLLILCLGIFFFPLAAGQGVTRYALALAAAGLLGVLLIPSIIRLLSRRSLPLPRGGRAAQIISAALRKLAPLKGITAGRLLAALAFSLLFQFTDIAVTFLIARTLGIALSVEMLLFAMPLVYLATVLPISPGGLGLRESTLVIVLGQFGIAPAAAALLAVAVFLNRVLVGLVGGLLYLAACARSGGKPDLETQP